MSSTASWEGGMGNELPNFPVFCAVWCEEGKQCSHEHLMLVSIPDSPGKHLLQDVAFSEFLCLPLPGPDGCGFRLYGYSVAPDDSIGTLT